jgi:hypothetical protein
MKNHPKSWLLSQNGLQLIEKVFDMYVLPIKKKKWFCQFFTPTNDKKM